MSTSIANPLALKVQMDSASDVSKIDSAFLFAVDTVKAPEKATDTIFYTKEEFNRIVAIHPELTTDFWVHPDEKYSCIRDSKEFRSEIGQDNYFVLYAHILKQKNGVKRYALMRRRLIDVYKSINSLFAFIQHGGTYFGHQSLRILGYAEYSIFLYSERSDGIGKMYDITDQKKLYITSLRQLIVDESKIDDGASPQDKSARLEELNVIVDDLDKQITDIFYLGSAQEFQYRHYSYF